MENESRTIEVTLSQESVDAIAKAVSDVMFDLLNDFLIPLREGVQEIKSKTDLISINIDNMIASGIAEKEIKGMVNVCPDIPDDWRGNRADTARVLGIDPKTLDNKAVLGRRMGGIDWIPNRSGRGKTFIGKEIKRFWRYYR